MQGGALYWGGGLSFRTQVPGIYELFNLLMYKNSESIKLITWCEFHIQNTTHAYGHGSRRH